MIRLITNAAVALMLITAVDAAVSYSGTALKNVQDSSQTDLVAGRLALLVVDTGNDGFLNGTVTSGNPISAASISNSGLNTGLGQSFAGDVIVARLTTAVSFGDTFIAGTLASFENTGVYQSRNFAIVWFDTLTTAGSETVASGKFGIASGADWTMPGANDGSFTFGTGASNLDQITLGNPSTAAVDQGVRFATNGATFTVIPEPSAILLTLAGSLLLLRRSRVDN